MSDNQRSGGEVSAGGVTPRLARLGSQSVDVSAERLDAIEARVRASMERDDSDERGSGPAVIVSGGATGVTRRSSLWPRVALVAASILAVFALSIAVLGNADDTLVVAAADDVVVLLPGGGSVIASDGTELPDGSFVDVSGFVEVGGRRYGPGRYRVEDGRLVPLADNPAQVVNTDGDATEDTGGGTISGDPDAQRTRPLPMPPGTADQPTVSSTRSPVPSTTRPANPTPPSTRPATTTPSRTTVPDRVVPQRVPTTLPDPPTRPPASEPATTLTRSTTTTTTTTTTATTTTVVRSRPPADESPPER